MTSDLPPEVSIKVLAPDQQMLTWNLAEETPVALIYNHLSYAIMLCTPSDMENFALGFSFTEQIILKQNQIQKIHIQEKPQGLEVRLSIEPSRLKLLKLRMARRTLPGRSCGYCGLDRELEFFETLLPLAPERLQLSEKIIQLALTQFEVQQTLKRSNKSVHAAAWIEPDGELFLIREDVGRHNALDKLVGALLMANNPTESGFLLISSRCSYDILLKAARAGMRAIVSLSAPTAFALRKAQEANITLYTTSKNGTFRINP